MFTDSVGWIVCLLSASADLALVSAVNLPDVQRRHKHVPTVENDTMGR